MRRSNPFSVSVHHPPLPLTALRMHLPSAEDNILNFLGNEQQLYPERRSYSRIGAVGNLDRSQMVCGLNGFWGTIDRCPHEFSLHQMKQLASPLTDFCNFVGGGQAGYL